MELIDFDGIKPVGTYVAAHPWEVGEMPSFRFVFYDRATKAEQVLIRANWAAAYMPDPKTRIPFLVEKYHEAYPTH
ncbi:hypothetical protein JJJA_0013 [Achromobacter phage JWDelta]|uniref:Uncharacterized protein n=1 Tax=Achromobacter phage JWDelta TaxID=1416008 RepID=V9SHK9_9CAUD|nr:hypothetical protein JJJA_0013 [Achromobacter phage JWDelta]